jgi:hypothetical protein
MVSQTHHTTAKQQNKRIEVKSYSELNRVVLLAGNDEDGKHLYRYYRLWMLLRHLDTDGRGFVDLKRAMKACRIFRIPSVHLKEAATDPQAAVFLKVLPEREIVEYRSLQAVGTALRTTVGVPVLIDVHELPRDKFKAALYGAWMSAGRDNCRTMSRRTITELTGLSDETQRRYERQCGIQARPNVGRAPKRLIIEETDKRTCLVPQSQEDDRLGERFYYTVPGDDDNVYWRMPNTYTANDVVYQRARTGNSRKVNRRLRTVVYGGTVPQPVFFRSDKHRAGALVRGHCYQEQKSTVKDLKRWQDDGAKVQRVDVAQVWQYSTMRPFSGNLREKYL